MARERDFPASRKPRLESTTTWILGMLGLGIVAALLVLTVAPPANEETNVPKTSTDQVVPNTPPPVRTE
jgi:hypothetical protein